MTDVTNPGVVNVASETYGNPDPNGGTAVWKPEDDDALEAVAGQGFSPAENGVDAEVFPTPSDERVDEPPPLVPTSSSPEPDADEIYVDEQSLGLGNMVPVDPGNLAAGYRFASPADFIVTGPAESFQTNFTQATVVALAVTAVLDADDLPNAADASSLRYYLVLGGTSLTSYYVSLLGRQILFADDTLTANDRGAARIITGYGAHFVVIDRDDPTEDNGDVDSLTLPQAGDVILVDVNRQGSEQINTRGETVNVFLAPAPPAFEPDPAQGQASSGSSNVSTGPQPGAPYIGSGTQVPTARTVEVADQSAVVGLPANIYV